MTVYVQCKVSSGLFDNEVVVEVAGTSTIVSSKIVRAVEGADPIKKGEVKAFLIEKQEEQGLVEIPGEAIFGGNTTWVPNHCYAFA